MKILLYSIVAVATLVFTFSCTKTSLVGSDLFGPDVISLFYEEDFDIKAFTSLGDSVVTYDGFNSIGALLVGEIDDPVFGTTKGEAFVNLVKPSTAIPLFQYTQDGVARKSRLDSVVLILDYAESSFYGDSTLAHDVEIRILDEAIFTGDTLFSSFKPAGEGTLIGSKTFVPSYSDSISVLEPGDSEATKFGSQVRITLDNSWVQAMFDDTTLISSASNFAAYVPGLQISSTTTGSSTWGISYGSETATNFSAVRIYYTRDTIPSIYNLFVSGGSHCFYENDHQGSEVESFLGSEEKGDSLLFVQGLSGTYVDLDIPVLGEQDFNDFLINEAQLQFYVLEDESAAIHSPIESIILERINDTGLRTIVEDAFVSSTILTNGSFDGLLAEETIDGMTLKKYTARLTLFANERLEETSPNTRVRLVPTNRSITPNRSVIYGPGHSKYPMKFKINYSR